MKKIFLTLFLLGLLVISGTNAAFAQAPSITYTTHNPAPYVVGTAISTLTPTNTGGAVSAGFYSFSTFVTLPDAIYSVATDAYSNVYTLDYATHYLYKYNSSAVGGTFNTTSTTEPVGITVDPSGNVFVSDYSTKDVYKFNSSGTLTATITGFTQPYGVATDASGNLYVADEGANSIVKVAAGSTTRVTLLSGFASNPYGVAINGNDVYVSEYLTTNVIKVANGITGGTTQTTFASTLNAPRNMTFDALGNLYVADYGNNRVALITPAGVVSTCLSGLNAPRDVTFDVSDILYIANSGSDQILYSTNGNYAISPALPAGLSFNTSTGVISGTPTVVSSPTVYTVTAGNTTGTSTFTITISTVVAAPSLSYSPTSVTLGLNNAMTPLAPTNSGGAVPANTYATVSTFLSGTINKPRGIVSDGNGNLYEADNSGNAIYMINSSGTATKIAGTGTAGEVDNATGTSAQFNAPTGIVYDGAGYLYVVDNGTATAGNTIRKISTTSPYAVTTIAGASAAPSELDNATGTSARFNRPYGITYDGVGYLYVTDNGNGGLAGNTIRKISTTSPYAVVTIAGASGAGSEVNNATGTSARFNGPAGITYDGSANLYVTDEAGNTIRQISTTSPYAVTTFAGSGTAGSANGTGTAATFKNPWGIDIDASGNLLIADEGNNLIRYITTPGAVVTTLAGSGATTETNAVGTAASFNTAYAICTDNAGNAFVGDNNTTSLIRKILLTGYTISPTALPTGLSFAGTTGIISGTPTAAQGATAYTVTGYNATGSSSATITITVALIVPNISYSASPVSLLVNTAVGTAPNPTVTVSNTGGAVGTFGYGSATTLTSTGISSPIGISLDASGNLYVVNSGGKVYKYTGATGTAAQFASGVTMTNPVGIVFDSSGNCYVLDASGTKIYKINSSGSLVTTITLTGATTVSGIAIDASNNLYITNYNGTTSSSIIKYNTGTSTQSTFATGTNNKPSGIAVDNAGNVYVTNLGSNTATKYNSAGTIVTASFATGFNSPRSVWIDGSDNVYIGDAGTANKIFVYSTTPSSTTAGTPLTNFTSTAPYGGDSDSQGDIYVTNNTGNLVYKYAPTGGYFASSLPVGVALTSSTGALSTSSTPTAVTAATNYTITAWNAAGSDNTLLNITCYNTYRWVGNAGTGSKTDWTNTGNWNGGVVPSSADQAQIGVVSGAVNNMPIIPAGTTINVGSIVMGTLGTTVPSPVITVNGTGVLNVSGDITYESTNTGTATTSPGASLAGTGTISANNLNVTLANSTSTGTYNETLSSSITTLNLSGNVNLVSTNTGGGTKYQNALFNLTGGTMTTNGFASTNAVAGNTSTFTISTNTTIDFTGTAAFSGLSSTGTNTITGLSGTGVTIGYTGSNAQTVYTDASIANSSLTSGISYTNLAFSGTTGIKTALSGNINVTGSFTNSLTSDATTTYVDFSSPTVNFTGTAAQALAGGAGVGTTFYNVTFSGNSTKTMSGLFNVASTGTLSMNGTSSANILNAGTGVLTLKSDASSSATVAAIGNSQSITGSVNVQRFITGGAGMRGYRLMSSPVYGGSANSNNVYSINYIASSCYVTGTTVSTPGPGIDKTGNPTLYLFRENLTPSQLAFTAGNFRGVGDMGTTGLSNITYGIDVDGSGYNIPVGNGFLFFFRGDRSVQPIATETVPTYVPTNTVLTSTGTLNQGSIVVHDWYTPTSANLGWTNTTTPAPGNAAVQGYNLVGNPYASAISWTAVYAASSNVGVSTYQFNPATNQYSAYIEGAASGTGGSGDVIGSGQGFFVIASNTSAVLNFSEAEKVTSQPSTLLFAGKKSLAAANSQQYLHLKMVTDSVNYDDVIIAFKPTASAKYSVNEDAIHLKGNSPPETLTALSSDSVGLSINYLPLQGKQTVVGLNANATASGIFTFSRTELVGIPTLYNIWLKDNLLKDSLDLRANSTYQFAIDNTNPASYGPNRFQLVFSQNPALALHLLNFVGAKVANAQQAQLTWTVENESNYTTFNVQRSTDGGKTWSIIGTLQSNNSGTYNYVDNNPVIGQDLYRLQLVDLDGGITYSQVITINFTVFGNNGANALSVYPNPAHDLINISINTAGSANAYSIVFTSNTGSVVKRVESASASSQQDISALVPGIYYISMIDNGTKSVIAKSKFVKL